MKITMPTYLSIFRLLAVLIITLGFLILDRPEADIFAVLLFAIAAATDFLDGMIARRFNMVSMLGKIIDPISDKILVMNAFLLILVFYNLSSWTIVPIGIILFRELFITGLREFLANEKVQMEVTFLAKLKTALQMVTIVAVFLSGVLVGGSDLGSSRPLEWLCVSLIWLSGIHSLVTGWGYFRNGMRLLEVR